MTTIAEKNDLMRKTFMGCRVVMTQGVRVLDDTVQSEIVEMVQKFTNFNESNDPHQEHDFGSFDCHDIKFFWKFDYFDDKYEFFQEDGNRVLTIMKADEY